MEFIPVHPAHHHPMMDDGEWTLVAPFLQIVAVVRRRPPWIIRRIFEAILFVLRTGCQWRHLSTCFPPRSTVHRWFVTTSGAIDRLNHRLVMLDRERAGREASPTAAVMNTQSVKTSVTGGAKGYDDGKRFVGAKRHVMVDTDGRLLLTRLSGASLHDARTAVPLLVASSLALRRDALRRRRIPRPDRGHGYVGPRRR